MQTPAPRSASVIGPDGQLLNLGNLPAPGMRRWVARRKAEVVTAVAGGILSIGDACARYGLSLEEFMAWEDGLHRHGLLGLRHAGPASPLRLD